MEKSEFYELGNEDNCDSFAIVQEDGLDNDVGYSSQMLDISQLRIQQLPGPSIATKEEVEQLANSGANEKSKEGKALRFELDRVDEESVKHSGASDIEETINILRRLKEEQDLKGKLLADTNVIIKKNLSELVAQKRLYDDAIKGLKNELQKKKFELEELKDENVKLKQEIAEVLKSKDSSALQSLVKQLSRNTSLTESEHQRMQKERELANECEEVCRSGERLQKETSGAMASLKEQHFSVEQDSFRDMREKLADFTQLSQEFDSAVTESEKELKEKESVFEIVKMGLQETLSTNEPNIDSGKSPSSFGSFQKAKRAELFLCLKCLNHFNGEDEAESHNKLCESIF